MHETAGINDRDGYFGTGVDFTPGQTVASYISPLPPKLSIQRVALAEESVTWTTNTAGVLWGLEFASNLVTGSWIALPDSSPYTNNNPENRIFRARAK